MVEDLIGSGFSAEAIVLITSMLPILELRGSIPIAINVFDMPWYKALSLAIMGNMLPVPILLLFFKTVARLCQRSDFGRKLIDWIFRRTRRNMAIVEKYERIGLMIFVAIPLPVTGAWTGSIAAFLAGINFNRSLLSIAVGVIIAGVIVTCLSLLGWIGAVLAGFILCGLAAFGLWKF